MVKGESMEKIFFIDNFNVNAGFSGYITRATTASVAISAASLIAAGNWFFLGVTYSVGAGPPKLYKGTPTSMIAEVSYSSTTAGSGAEANESTGNFYLGNNSATTYSFDGKLAHGFMFDKVLTVAEMATLQFGGLTAIANLCGYWPLWGVATPEPDLSGNVNNGTVTGALLARHAPVGRYAPYRFRTPLFAIYIITGITRDASGDPVGSCTVWLFRASDKSYQGTTISDAATGAYAFNVGDDTTEYFIRAHKDGVNVFGTTDRDLIGQ